MSRSFGLLVYGLAAGFFGCFLFWPIGQSLRSAFVDANGHFTTVYVAEIFQNRIYLEGLWNALLVAIVSTALGFLLAVPLALLADRYDFPGKKLLSSMCLVPLILPPFVGAIGVRQILGQQGVLNAVLHRIGMLEAGATIDWLGEGRFWGVVILIALHLYPILYLNLTAALANLDPALGEAAINLGCTGLRRFRRITLPLIMPGVFAGGTIVFIWSFTELGVPLMFDYTRLTSVQIFYGIKEISGNPFPYALVAVTLVATLLLYLLSKVAFGRTSPAMTAKASTAGGSRETGAVMGWLCAGFFCFVTFVALLPHMGVILISVSTDWYGTILPEGWTLSHYQMALGHGLTVPSIVNSLKYAAAATALDVLLGTAIAFVIVRTTLKGRALLDAVSMLPLAVPGLVLAFGYVAMTQPGRVFSFLNPESDPALLLIIAYGVRRLPYVVRSAVAGLQQTSVSLEEAAQSLGCPPFRAFRKITLPLITANLIAGGLLAFSFAMLEVSDSLILAQRQQDFPITKAIYELFQLLGEGRYLASALGVWAMVFLGVTMLGASLILGKKLGALFRV